MSVMTTTETADRQADEATPGCGCCIPPPDQAADKGLAQLQARRAALEHRLRGLQADARA